MQIEINPSAPLRAQVKALRIAAAGCELVVCSPDADPQVKSVLASLQGQMETAARKLETQFAA